MAVRIEGKLINITQTGGAPGTVPKKEYWCECKDVEHIPLSKKGYCGACEGKRKPPEPKPELASEKEIRGILVDFGQKNKKLLVGDDINIDCKQFDDLAHALIGKVGKPEPKKEIEELERLLALVETGKPIPITILRDEQSITIEVKSKDDTLIKPIKIDDTLITHLGIYEIKGTKFWIVKE